MSPVPPKAFKHQPLEVPEKQIRLFYPHKNGLRHTLKTDLSLDDSQHKTTAIFGYLQHVCLDNLPNYVALFYTWGSSDTPIKISVDGLSLEITANLQAVLGLFARLPELQGLPLWVDSICINQKDNDEKKIQVPLMGRIYSKASRVIAWIGDEEDGSADVLDNLVTLGDFWLGLYNEFDGFYDEIQKVMILTLMGLDRNIKASPNNPTYQAYRKIIDATQEPNTQTQALFERAWWHRVWVIQEFTLAKDASILCGTRLFSWKKVIGAIHFFFSTHVDLSPTGQHSGMEALYGPVEHFLVFRDRFRQNHRAWPPRSPQLFDHSWEEINQTSYETGLSFERGLSCLIRLNHDAFEASDERDRVYAFLAFFSQTSRDLIRVDYGEDTRFSDVVNGITREMFQRKGPRILVYCQSNSIEAKDLPSWFIDWTRVEKSSIMFDPDEHSNLKASGNASWCSEKLDMDNALQLPFQGIKVSTVDLIETIDISPSPASPSPVDSREQDGEKVKELVSWIRRMETFLSESPEDSPARAARKLLSRKNLWLIPIAGLQDYRYRLKQLRLEEETTQYAFQTAIGERKVSRSFGKDTWDYWRHLHLKGNKGFVTPDGMAGLGPRSMQKDDIVVISKGCEFPFVIRPRCEERKEYELFGACYVDGIMMGEAIEENPTFEKMFLV